MARGRGILRVVAVNLGLVVGGLLVAELVFGDWFEEGGLGALRVPRNVHLTHEGEDQQGSTSTYHRDRYGLRGRYKSPAHIDILAIGGSTTNELYVGDGQTWTDGLAANFRNVGRAISVVNAGVDGHSTVGHLESFDRWFPRIPGLKARYILVYAGINDIHLELSDNARYDRLRSNGDGQAFWNAVRRYIRDSSALYSAYRSLLGLLRAKRGGLIHRQVDWEQVTWVEHPEPRSIPPLSETLEGLRAGFGERLGMIIERTRGVGAEPIIVTQHRAGYRRSGGRLLAAKGDRWSGELAEYLVQAAFNRRALEVCRAKAAICLDLAEEVEFQVGDFHDYVHTSPRGSRRIADYLFVKLESLIR